MRIYFLWRSALADAEDEHVLDLAMNGQADMFVTFNQDDFVEAPETFQMEVITPTAALTIEVMSMRARYFALKLQPSLLEELRSMSDLERRRLCDGVPQGEARSAE